MPNTPPQQPPVILPEEKAINIAKKAVELVFGWHRGTAQKARYRLINAYDKGVMPNQKIMPSFSMTDFADYVVLAEHTSDWGKPDPLGHGDFVKDSSARRSPRFYIYDESKSPMPQSKSPLPQSLGDFSSWLYFVRPGEYAVIFNEAAIHKHLAENGLPINDEIVCKIKMRLFYHELSHFVFHRKKLIKAKNDTTHSAEHYMEEEAWILAGCIIALGVGNQSIKNIVGKNFDCAWADF